MLAALTKFYSGRAWAAGDTRQAPGLLFPNIGRYGIKSWPICLDDGFCLELYIDTWFVIGWQARGIYSLELADFLNLAAFSLTIPFFSCEILMSCAFWMPGQPPASFLGYTREMLNHWSMRAGILLETLVMSLSQHPRGAKHLVKLKQLFSNKTSGSPVPGTSSSGWCFGTWVLFSISSMGCHPSHWRTQIFQDGYCTTNQLYDLYPLLFQKTHYPLWIPLGLETSLFLRIMIPIDFHSIIFQRGR